MKKVMKINKLIKISIFSVVTLALFGLFSFDVLAAVWYQGDGTAIVYIGDKVDLIKKDPFPVGISCTENYNEQSGQTEVTCSTSVEAGYLIDSYAPSKPDATPPTGPTISFKEDGIQYNQYYNISPGGSGSANPPVCTGGLLTRINCVPGDGYVKDVCPHDQATMAEPHYCQGGGTFNVEFKEYRPEVTVFGKDNDGNEYTGSMTVQKATSGEKNVEIYWKSWDVTKCDCTWTGGGDGCGTGISLRPNESVFANGSFSNGGFSLTSDTTFTVKCD